MELGWTTLLPARPKLGIQHRVDLESGDKFASLVLFSYSENSVRGNIR